MRSFFLSGVIVTAAGFAAFACSSSESHRTAPGESDGGIDSGVPGAGGRGTGGAGANSGGLTGFVADASAGGSSPSSPDGSPGDAWAVPDSGDAPDAASRDATTGVDAADAGPKVKIAFVTSEAYDGNLGGLLGADAKCQRLADAARLEGTFLAWLSDASDSPSTRFTHPTEDYVLTDRKTVVAHGWTGITQPTLHGVTLTERVWTTHGSRGLHDGRVAA